MDGNLKVKYWLCISAFLLAACSNDAQLPSVDGAKEKLTKASGAVEVRPIEVLGLNLREANVKQLIAAIKSSGGIFLRQGEGYVEYDVSKIFDKEDAYSVYLIAWFLPSGAVAEVRYRFKNGIKSPDEKMQEVLDAMKVKYDKPTSTSGIKGIDSPEFFATWDRGSGAYIKLYYAENDGFSGNYPLLGYVNSKAADEWNLLDKARELENRASKAANVSEKL